MELEFADGASIPIDIGPSTEIGRGLGLGLGPSPIASDQTVSRRHLSLKLLNDTNEPDAEPRVSFQVIGSNPILVLRGSGDDRVYRRSERGELEAGDRVSLSLKNPYFLNLKRKRGGEAAAASAAAADKGVLDAVERREKRTRERKKEKERESEGANGSEGDNEESFTIELEDELGALDVSLIDPVKEFGFLVRGHEFDQYPIRAPSEWNWFLDEPRKDGAKDEDTDEGASSKGKGKRRKKKKGSGGDKEEDEEWTGESEDEKVLALGGRSGKRPRYSTRSKDPKKPRNDDSVGRKTAPKKDASAPEDELDEGDETLGGFIVDEEDEAEEEEEEEEEVEDEVEEEEELEDEEESDDD